MFTDYCWPRLLVLSAALLLPVHATTGHVKRQQQETAKQRWDELHSNYLDGLQSTLEQDGQCTWDTMVVRREWYAHHFWQPRPIRDMHAKIPW